MQRRPRWLCPGFFWAGVRRDAATGLRRDGRAGGWLVLGQELPLIQGGVQAAALEQFGVGAVVVEAPVVEDEDHVGAEHGG